MTSSMTVSQPSICIARSARAKTNYNKNKTRILESDLVTMVTIYDYLHCDW